ALAGSFHEGVAKRGNRLLQPRRSALALAESVKRIAEIVLDCGPVERRALPGVFLKSAAKRDDRLLQPRRPALARAEHLKHSTEIGLARGPVEGCAFAGVFLEGVAKGGDRLLQPRRPALAPPESRKRSRKIKVGFTSFLIRGGIIQQFPSQCDLRDKMYIAAAISPIFVKGCRFRAQKLGTRRGIRPMNRFSQSKYCFGSGLPIICGKRNVAGPSIESRYSCDVPF